MSILFQFEKLPIQYLDKHYVHKNNIVIILFQAAFPKIVVKPGEDYAHFVTYSFGTTTPLY